ncbi:MAG: glycosyltransferase family 4 protein [Clostridium sp.]
MKVLHICSYYIGSKLYKNLITNLDELGVSNEVYIPINSDKLINKNYKDGLKNTNYIYSKNFNNLDRLNFKLKMKKIYKDMLNKVNLSDVDTIHAHSLFVNGYIAYKLKQEKNIDYIVAVRNTDINVFFKYMPHLRTLGIEIMQSAKKVIFISHSYRDYMLENYIDEDMKLNLEVIPNGVNQFWIENICLKKKKIDNQINLIYVGEFNKNKNVESLIHATKLLNQKGYCINLNLVGKGNRLKKIKKLSSSDVEHIKIHGYMEKEQLIKLYKDAHIFAMVSQYETFGLVYVEALTQGVPVIYTKGQGFDGYFKDGYVGYSANYNDIDNICEKIEDLIKNYNEVSSFKRDKIYEFNWNTVAKKYISIYENITKS